MSNVYTGPFAFGFHVVARAVLASKAAILFRVCPPMLVNAPPAYTVLPERIIE
jgi:hypothetical protein